MENKKRLPARAREAFQMLCGIEAVLTKYEPDFEPIVKRHKNGWRDYRLMRKKLEQINTGIMESLPIDQYKTIIGQMMVTEMRMIVKKADEVPTDQWMMDRGDVAYLINKAVETTCIMCDGSCRHKCQLRRLVDETPVDVQGSGMLLMACRGFDI